MDNCFLQTTHSVGLVQACPNDSTAINNFLSHRAYANLSLFFYIVQLVHIKADVEMEEVGSRDRE